MFDAFATEIQSAKQKIRSDPKTTIVIFAFRKQQFQPILSSAGNLLLSIPISDPCYILHRVGKEVVLIEWLMEQERTGVQQALQGGYDGFVVARSLDDLAYPDQNVCRRLRGYGGIDVSRLMQVLTGKTGQGGTKLPHFTKDDLGKVDIYRLQMMLNSGRRSDECEALKVLLILSNDDLLKMQDKKVVHLIKNMLVLWSKNVEFGLKFLSYRELYQQDGDFHPKTGVRSYVPELQLLICTIIQNLTLDTSWNVEALLSQKLFMDTLIRSLNFQSEQHQDLQLQIRKSTFYIVCHCALNIQLTDENIEPLFKVIGDFLGVDDIEFLGWRSCLPTNALIGHLYGTNDGTSVFMSIALECICRLTAQNSNCRFIEAYCRQNTKFQHQLNKIIKHIFELVPVNSMAHKLDHHLTQMPVDLVIVYAAMETIGHLSQIECVLYYIVEMPNAVIALQRLVSQLTWIQIPLYITDSDYKNKSLYTHGIRSLNTNVAVEYPFIKELVVRLQTVAASIILDIVQVPELRKEFQRTWEHTGKLSVKKFGITDPMALSDLESQVLSAMMNPNHTQKIHQIMADILFVLNRPFDEVEEQ